ncbi:hypothetical protein RchiOBHm_Chr7g0203961 [Rosa chinensis]|uniref:Uncharacterized protein n=1 Tax=Rosa chinensis TaxID=74649 RepID=A0A2P6P8J9_ROSCH|nr:hypothetical protein RchiOBHm_Chr7g0203961 [Rosa chinensis]
MASLYVKAVPPADLNRNTEWFVYLAFGPPIFSSSSSLGSLCSRFLAALLAWLRP